jgi:monomeric sarcosine oxidase
MRVTVVGAGVMGLATAYELARRGHEVTVLEQFDVEHTRGSSHGRSRIVRLAYPDAEWVRLAQESMRRWRQLEEEAREALLDLTGLVELDPTSTDALDESGVPHEELDEQAAFERFGIGLAGASRALFQPEAGTVRADLARRAFLDGARQRGAQVVEHTRVERLDDVDGDVVVVTAGAWAKGLLAGVGIDLPVVPTRETVAYFRLARDGSPPSVAELKKTGHGFYALADPVHGLKAGYHRSGPVTDPDDEGTPDDGLVQRIASWAGEVFELADPEPVGAETCIYTSTEDERFVLERHGRIVVGSACSGHGFKFAPIVGARLADLATGS